MNMKKYITLLALLFIGVLTGYSQQSAYLFVYFTGNRMSEEAVRMAVSLDGYNYKALNGNQPVLDSRVISSTGGDFRGIGEHAARCSCLEPTCRGIAHSRR